MSHGSMFQTHLIGRSHRFGQSRAGFSSARISTTFFSSPATGASYSIFCATNHGSETLREDDGDDGHMALKE